jgi:aldehyde:ferredoxin oxidoreductase
LFIAFAILDQADTFDALVDLLNAFTGQSWTGDDLVEQGKAILKMERDFNFRAGMTEKDDRLPEYFKKEKLAPHNIVFAVKDEDLDQVHNW